MIDDATYAKQMAEARLRFPPIWVIYDRPLDHPEHYVIRVWYGTLAEVNCELADSLQEAQDKIVRAGGCAVLARHPDDDPYIVETWL